MIRDFINVNEVSNQLENNYMKVMLDSESYYRGQLFKVANQILKHRKKYIIVLTIINIIKGVKCHGKNYN